MSDDLGFRFQTNRSGDIQILRDGKVVTVLRRETAEAFLSDIEDAGFTEQQEMMARLTGNYKRGNERLAKQHPRRKG